MEPITWLGLGGASTVASMFLTIKANDEVNAARAQVMAQSGRGRRRSTLKRRRH
ncbi:MULTISPECIES: hypothetical protein [unclassified Bradyrhizobium]